MNRRDEQKGGRTAAVKSDPGRASSGLKGERDACSLCLEAAPTHGQRQAGGSLQIDQR